MSSKRKHPEDSTNGEEEAKKRHNDVNVPSNETVPGYQNIGIEGHCESLHKDDETHGSVYVELKEDTPKHFPGDPTILSEGKDAIVISQSNSLAGVTALAIAPIINSDYPALYSGHEDGKVCKWSSSTNTKLWERQIFANRSGDKKDPGKNVKYGVHGIAVSENSSGEHLVHVWSNCYESATNIPNEVRVLDEKGDLSYALVCEVDEMELQPSISCVVCSKLKYNEKWEDAVIVGLKATAEVLENDEKYTEFDLDEAEDFAYGNILPFVGEEVEETWRAHSGVIYSMASIPDEFIISCSENTGNGLAEMIVLWSAHDPGVPVHRIDLHQAENSIADSFHPLKCLQGGISIFNNKILLGCNKGDLLVPIDVIKDSNELHMRGFAKIGQIDEGESSLNGCLVGSGNSVIIKNEASSDLWIFPISSLGDNPIIDTDLSKRSAEAIDNYNGGKDGNGILLARGMAVGKITLPTKTSNSQDPAGAQVLAMKGRWIVAGYACGSILRPALLPERFKDETRGANSNASFSFQTDGFEAPHFDTLDHPAPPQPECCIQ